MTRDLDKRIQALESLGEERPEYRETAGLFAALSRYEAAAGDGGMHFAAMGGAPFPLATPERMTVDRGEATRFLSGLVTTLRGLAREGEDDLDRIGGALAAGRLPLAELFASALRRDRSAISEAAADLDVSPQLLEFILEFPLREALTRFAATVAPVTLEEWGEGTCPVCGARPAMGELTGEEGTRFLFCSSCSCRWPFSRIACPFCCTDDSDQLAYIPGERGLRIDTCRRCSRYLKTRDRRLGGSSLPLEVEELGTLHLDIVAQREGFLPCR